MGSASQLPPLTLGTAGHIDHGKTALVVALTGKDTDRLPEEHRRGISIELGYAPLELPSGRRLSVVDVPGHERFVRTMVAGASGVDLYLLCVAADDGVMPQTREHLAVLRQLGVRHGVAAITKADLSDHSPAAAELAELLPGVEVVPVSARAGTGVEELRHALDRVAAPVHSRASGAGGARLHLDRSFTLRGIGTVVTGTLWSGSIGRGDAVRILPRDLKARVRSVQVHDRPVERAPAGQRVALNLAGVAWRELRRGDVVIDGDARLAPTYLIDAAISLESNTASVDRGTRLHVHHGTREAPARVVPLEGGALRPDRCAYAQLRLEAPLMPAAGDRLVIRALAPPDTIGGGVVIDPQPRKHGPGKPIVDRLTAMERGEDPSTTAIADDGAREPSEDRDRVVLDSTDLRIAALLTVDGRAPRTDADLANALGLSATATADHLRRLSLAGRAVRVGRNLHFHPEALAGMRAEVAAICAREGEVTIARVRDALDTSRKYAQAVLEHMDAAKITVRRGDAHVLRRRR